MDGVAAPVGKLDAVRGETANHLRMEVSRDTLEQWLAPARLSGELDGTHRTQAQAAFPAQWLQQRMQGAIRHVLQQGLGSERGGVVFEPAESPS